MRNLKKTLVSIVLSGACAISLTAAACDSGDTQGTTHEHSYASTWTFDSTNHWHAATCGDDTKSDEAAHVDANNDGKCDVCDYTYPHEHVYSPEWTSDEKNHWHEALCGHDTVSGQEAHTPDATGYCTVCGYKVSDPDVSTIEKAIEVATLSMDKVETANGTITYRNTAYSGGRTSTYRNSAHYYSDYTYLSVTEGWTTEYWFTPTEYGLFTVTSEDGATPSVTNDDYDDDYIYGFRFTNPSTETTAYYGVTNYVAGLYNYAVQNDLLVDESIEGDEYSFSYNEYILTYDEQTGDRTPTSDRYYSVTVSFTLGDDYFIDWMYAESKYWSGDQLDFSAYEESEPEEGTEEGTEDVTEGTEDTATGDTEEGPTEDVPEEETEIGEGTVPANTDPFITYTYTFTQSRETNPYDPDEIMVEGFDLVNRTTGEVVSGETANSASTVNVGLTNNENIVLDIANLDPATADISLDRLSVSVLAYNEATDDYETSYWGLFTSVNTTNKTLTITGSVAGTYRVVLTSTFLGLTRYINVVAAPAAPSAINALVNGSSVDSFNSYVDAGITITASVDYGYVGTFTASITSDNAANASLVLDASGSSYTFTATQPGTYKVTVASTENDAVVDTVEIVVESAPELSSVFNGTYKMEYTDNNSSIGWDTTAYIMFTPDAESTNGTLNYSFTINTGSSTTAYNGTCTYSYDAEGNVTISGLADVGANESGLQTLEVELNNYAPVLTGEALYMAQSWNYETWEQEYVQRTATFTLDAFVRTTDAFPGTGGGEEGGEGDTGELTVEELLTTTTWTATMSDSAGDPWLHTLIFNSDGTGVVVCGEQLAGTTSAIYFSWTVEGYDVTVEYTGGDKSAYDMPEINDVRSTFMTITDNGGGSYTVSWCGVNFSGTNSGSVGDSTPAFVGTEYFCESYGEWGATIWFDEAGWCAVYDGTLPETGGYASSIVYMSWELDPNGDIATGTTVYGYPSDPDGYLSGFEAGMIATYDADSDTISFGGYTFEVPWWVY